MTGWLESPIYSVLEKGLDASSLRQKVLADNVGNVDTPNFKRSDVQFDRILGKALGEPDPNLPLKITNPAHIQSAAGSAQSGIVKDESTSLRTDGNNVDIDREMTNVAENGIYYSSVTQALTSQLGLLRMAIQGK